MNEIEIANGCVKAPKGEWLMAVGQPSAHVGDCRVTGQRGLVVPDRSRLRVAVASDDVYCASATNPFLTRLDAPPDKPVSVVSGKVLIAPRSVRTGARSVRLVPMSFRRTTVVTDFRSGWAVAATRSRVTRLALDEDATLSVRPDALVAWIGRDPTGFCRRMGVMDLLLPRGPRDLAFRFHGPAVVWFEGSSPAPCGFGKVVAVR